MTPTAALAWSLFKCVKCATDGKERIYQPTVLDVQWMKMNVWGLL